MGPSQQSGPHRDLLQSSKPEAAFLCLTSAPNLASWFSHTLLCTALWKFEITVTIGSVKITVSLVDIVQKPYGKSREANVSNHSHILPLLLVIPVVGGT